MLFVSEFTMPSEIVENGLPSSSFFSDELCLPNEVVIACPLIGFCFYCAVCLMEISKTSWVSEDRNCSCSKR
ncbi:hypothetical protein RHGRI_033187 [Rhododendron griersonianum]|uniref:Uncharacterized protein n=1 Tax=Rhododendron griersonianum TaxID=479676 RepID=A0AAV6HW84_9ERIC|nr:hypothetical protein RHGRI_033187 [Rhododendron griersonianum]